MEKDKSDKQDDRPTEIHRYGFVSGLQYKCQRSQCFLKFITLIFLTTYKQDPIILFLLSERYPQGKACRHYIEIRQTN